MDVDLRRFDPSTIPDDRICLFIGRRGSGKSHCMKDILSRHKHIGSGVVFSATEDSNHFWGDCVPDTFIYKSFRPDVVANILARQRKIAKTLTGKGQKPPPVFIVCEDVLYDKTLKTDKTVREVFFNGRHWNIFFLVTMQYMMDIPPELRGNCDFVFVFQEIMQKNRARLYENFFGMFDSQIQFDTVLKACTNDYECLVLDTLAKKNNLSDQVFFYKSPSTIEPFKMGSAQYWQYHYLNYDPDKDDDAVLEVSLQKAKTIKVRKEPYDGDSGQKNSSRR